MKLSDLQALVASINTMGFKPEDVEVKFKNTWTQAEMQISTTKTTVEAGDKVTPIVRIDLSC